MDALDALHAEIRAHRGCGFEPCEQAAHLVPGEGSHTAEVVLLGEAPGAKEDELGLPFVGRSGRLLDELLAGRGSTARTCSSPTCSRRGRRATATPPPPRSPTISRGWSASSSSSPRGW